MPVILTAADERKLVGIKPELLAVVRQVALVSATPFMVVEGLRTKERQRELYNAKKSKTLNSKHLDGRAVDLAPLVRGRVSWDWSDFAPLISIGRRVSADLRTPIEFGYDWGWDAPHWELKT